MRPPTKNLALLGVALLILGPASVRIVEGRSADDPKPAKTERGGLLAKSAQGAIEVFFYRTGVRVFPRDASGNAVGVQGLTGTATFYHPNAPATPWFVRPLAPTAGGSLDLAIGLDAAPARGGRVVFDIAGLPGSEGSAEFTTPLEFAAAADGAPATAEAEPRYVYGPGASGFGYYEYPGPSTAPAARTAPAVVNYPSSGPTTAARSSSTRTRDWSTGRNLPGGSVVSKPWLRPRS